MPVHIEATLIHIEDDPKWQRAVAEDLQEKLTFNRFVSLSNIDELHEAFKIIEEPLIIIMDLQHNNGQLNFNGYDWIADHARDYLRRNARVIIFVLSAHLNSAMYHALHRYGIKDDHVYSKDNWISQLPNFVQMLRDDLEKIGREITMAYKGDPYLNHVIEAANQFSEYDESSDSQHEKILVPMLIQVKLDKWNRENIPDLQILGKTGDIFACRGTEASLKALLEDEAVISIEASRPADQPDSKVSVPLVNATQVHEEFSEYGDQVIIGIIDSGIDILHEAFRDRSGMSTRILGVWNQRDSTGTSVPERYLPYTDGIPGSFYSQQQIDQFVVDQHCPPSLRDPLGHGTHVASIAAGCPCGPFAGGIAPEAKLLVVIPDADYEVGQPQSVGYSISYQNALEFIKNFANEQRLPVVVNVSQGMNAGAHDGKSLLEIAFDRFTGSGREGGFAIVKSAGNQGDQDIHAQFSIPKSSQQTLSWSTSSAHDISIELWYPANLQLTFRLKSPTVTSIHPQEEIELMDGTSSGGFYNQTYMFSMGNWVQFTYIRSHEDNGDSRVLISLRAGKSGRIQDGLWDLIISNRNVNNHFNHTIHAWIERTDQRVRFTSLFSRDYSLSIPATANTVIATGALKHSSIPFEVADFSACGPTRLGGEKPELVAPGVDIHAAYSGTANGTAIKSGTSMAAPHVTGAIALLFSHREKRIANSTAKKRLNTNQIQRALQQTTQNYSGIWHKGMGYGMLDVERLFRYFED